MTDTTPNIYTTTSYGLTAPLAAGGKFVRHQVKRKRLNAEQVEIDIKYCGICHSDIHTVGETKRDIPWPMTPGHELAGKIELLKE